MDSLTGLANDLLCALGTLPEQTHQDLRKVLSTQRSRFPVKPPMIFDRCLTCGWAVRLWSISLLHCPMSYDHLSSPGFKPGLQVQTTLRDGTQTLTSLSISHTQCSEATCRGSCERVDG